MYTTAWMNLKLIIVKEVRPPPTTKRRTYCRFYFHKILENANYPLTTESRPVNGCLRIRICKKTSLSCHQVSAPFQKENNQTSAGGRFRVLFGNPFPVPRVFNLNSASNPSPRTLPECTREKGESTVCLQKYKSHMKVLGLRKVTMLAGIVSPLIIPEYQRIRQWREVPPYHEQVELDGCRVRFRDWMEATP